MNVLLVQLPHQYGCYYRPPSDYPLGLGYLINQLLDNNINVECLDFWLRRHDVKEMVEAIKKHHQADVIGISFYSTQYRILKSLVMRIRKFFNGAIVVGGPGVESNYRILFQTLPLDFGVVGEAEKSFINLLNNLTHPECVKGIVYKKNSEIIRTEREEYIKILDSLKFPNRDLLDFREYLNASKKYAMSFISQGEFSTNIIAGRGCPYSCNYCSKTFAGVRLRSIDNIISEINYLKESYNIKRFQFNDELVLVNKSRGFELCEKIAPLKIKWGCQGRLNIVDAPLLRAMKKSGCIYVGYGIESVTQKILDNMNKQQRAEDAVAIVNLTRGIGINPIVQYMFGYLGENGESLRNTVRFFRQIDRKAAGFITQPLPGTKLYEDCLRKGLITDEESYLEDLDFGYNRGEATINLSEFNSLSELNVAIKNTYKTINRNYYKKHPMEYVSDKFIKLQEMLRLFFSSSAAFYKKVINRLKNIG